MLEQRIFIYIYTETGIDLHLRIIYFCYKKDLHVQQPLSQKHFDG